MAQSRKSTGQAQNSAPDEGTSVERQGSEGPSGFDQIIELLKRDVGDERQRPPAPNIHRPGTDSTPPMSIPPIESDGSASDPFASSGLGDDPLEAPGGALSYGEGDLFGEEGFSFNFDDDDIDMSIDPFAEPSGSLTPAPVAPRELSVELPRQSIEVNAQLSEREISAPPASRHVEAGESQVPPAYEDEGSGGWGESIWADEGSEDSETRPISSLAAEPDPLSDESSLVEDLDESSDVWSRPPPSPSPPEQLNLSDSPAERYDELSSAPQSRAPEFSTYPPAAPPPQSDLPYEPSAERDPWQDEGGIMLEEESSGDPIMFPSEPDPAYHSPMVDFISPGDSAPPEELAAASGIPGASVIHVPTDAPTSMPIEIDEPLSEEPELLLGDDELTRIPSSAPAELEATPSESLSELEAPSFNFISTDEVKELEEVDTDESEDSPTVDLDDGAQEANPAISQPSAVPPEEAAEEELGEESPSYDDSQDPLLHLAEESQDLYEPEPATPSLEDDDDDEYEPEVITSDALSSVSSSEEPAAQAADEASDAEADDAEADDAEADDIEDLDESYLEPSVDPADQTFEAADPIALVESTEGSTDAPSDDDEPDTSLGLPHPAQRDQLMAESHEADAYEPAAEEAYEPAAEEAYEPAAEEAYEPAAEEAYEPAAEEAYEPAAEEAYEPAAEEAYEPAAEEAYEPAAEEAYEPEELQVASATSEDEEPETSLGYPEPSTELLVEPSVEPREPEEAPEDHEVSAVEPESATQPGLPVVEPVTFDYHPLELPNPQLEESWFIEHPLPALDHLSEHQQEALGAILESLYLALKVASDRERCVTYLCDLAGVAHEQVGDHEFALACAELASELAPESVAARTRLLRLSCHLEPERAAELRAKLALDEPELRLLAGHIAEAAGASPESWESAPGEHSPLYLPFATFMSALSVRDYERALSALDEVLTSVEDPDFKALLMSERLRLISYQDDPNATRSAIFRAVSESGAHATPSLLARIEREALNSQDLELLIESLRLRLGLSAIRVELLAEHQLESRSKDVGHMFYRLGWLLERAQRSQEAFHAYKLANDCITGESFVLVRLVSLAREVGAFDSLREALAQLAHQSQSSQEAANLLYQRGLVALYEQDDRAAAQRDFEAALQRFPTFSSALATLGQMAREDGDNESLQRSYSDEVEALERQMGDAAHALSDEEKVYHAYLTHTYIRRCYQLGTLLQEQLGESEIALTYHLKALAVDPAFTPSLIAIEEIYERQGRWSRLARLYSKRLEAAEGDSERALPLRLAIADISSSYLGDDRTANRHYAQVATFEGSEDLYALRRASETFEAIGERSSSILIEKRRAKLYKVESNRDELCGLRAASLQELQRSSSAERGGLSAASASQALPIYQQTWQAAPSAAAFDGLWRCALKSKQYESLNYYLTPRTLSNLGSKLLVTQAAEALLVTQQTARAVELMEIWAERSGAGLDQLSLDISAWAKRSAVGADPEAEAEGLDPRPIDDLGWRDYHSRSRAEQQVDVMSHEGDWRGANQALIRLASMLPPEEQSAIWYRVAYQTEVGLKSGDEAVSAYRHALRLDPGNHFALAALRRLSWVRGDLSLYHEVMAAYLSAEDHAGALEALNTHLGDLALYIEEEEARAFDFYGEALRHDSPESELTPMPLALRQRYSLHARRGSWSEALAELERYLPKLTSSSKAVALDWIALICELHIRDDERALSTNLSLVDIDPKNSRARRAARRLLAIKGDREAYLKHLKSSSYESHSELDALAIFTRCAHLYEQLAEPKKAERFWRKAFKVDPEFIPASQGIGRVIHARAGWTELVSLYRKELQAFPERSPGRVDVLRRLAELYERRLERSRVAATCYEDILEILPHDPVSLSGLDRIYSELGEWRSLAHVWSKHAELLTEPSAQGAALLRVGELYLAAGAEEEALNAYEHAYAVAPRLHPAAWAIEMIMYPRHGSGRLIELYRGARRHVILPFERQILTYKMILELSPNQIHHALKDDLYDEQESLEVLWWKVYTETERGDERAVAAALIELAKRIRDPQDAYSVALEAAHRASKGELTLERARPIWEQVLMINSRSLTAWVALIERAFLKTQKTRQWSDYRSLLARLAWVSEEPRHQAQALWTQGALEVRGVAEPQGGSARLSAELLEEAKRSCDHSLTPDLIALYLPQVKSRSVLIEHLRSLIARAPVGEMRGAALLTLAELEAYDAPEDALKLALEAAKNHQPSAIKFAEELHLTLNTPVAQPEELAEGSEAPAELDSAVESAAEEGAAEEGAAEESAAEGSEELLFEDGQDELEDEDDSAES